MHVTETLTVALKRPGLTRSVSDSMPACAEVTVIVSGTEIFPTAGMVALVHGVTDGAPPMTREI